MEDLELPVAGEGKGSKKKAKAGARSSEDGEEEENEKWVDALEIEVSTGGGRQEKSEEEEEEEEAAPLPAIGQAGRKHQGMVTSEEDTFLQVGQHSHCVGQKLLLEANTHSRKNKITFYCKDYNRILMLKWS